jgi:dTDP-4-amino-4,6-dideoxygalactose transaminase
MAGADALSEQLLSLPLYPRLTDDQIDAVCAALTQIAYGRFPRKGVE